MKEEFVERYKYLYNNALFILLPYIKEDNLNIKLDEKILSLLEEFLLSDITYKNSNLYKYLEEKNNDREYLNKVRNGIVLFERKNSNGIKNQKLDIWNILVEVRNYINSLNESEEIKAIKLDALDEYFRVARFKNIDEVWTSGYKLDNHDIMNYVINYKPSMEDDICLSDKYMSGLIPNEFCEYLDNKSNHYENLSILTEDEKKRIFFELNSSKLAEQVYDKLSR